MLISQTFPSHYIKCQDLQQRNVRVTIESVELETVGTGHDKKNMPVVYFRGSTKGLGLNKTNANTISSAYGDDTNNWIGQQIILVPSVTDFQGKTVDCVRIKIPQGSQPNRAPRPHMSEQEQSFDSEDPSPPHEKAMDDDIPF